MPTITTPAAVDFLGSATRILTRGDSSDGRLGLVHMDVPARHQSPLHVHHNEDEGFYLLGGEVTLFMPGEEITLREGDYLLAPRGVPHTYDVGDRGAQWLVTSTPAGFERFVAAVADLDAVDPETLTRVAAEHDIEILGPPGARP